MKPFKKFFHAGLALLLTTSLAISPAYADIQLDHVENGQVSVEQKGSQYNINATDNAIANFKTFNIGAGETVNFNLPSNTSSILNRVTGGAASDIMGILFSNGNVFLINPAGINFGAAAQVQAQGFVASTLNISNQDFMAGNYALAREMGSPAGRILNEGKINAENYIVLAGDAVENTGALLVQGGKVAIAAGDRVTLSLDQGNLVSVAVDEGVSEPAVDANGNAVKDLVKQAGQISAAGGQVYITAKAANNIFDHIINHTGIIEAVSLRSVNGRIVLDGGDQGVVRIAGAMDASGLEAGQTGGRIEVYGDKIGVVEQALLNVTGQYGGGTVLIGADYKGTNALHPASVTGIGADAKIQADAVEQGDGGKVIVWSQNTTNYYGNISAKSAEGKGGFAEVSSHGNLNFKGKTDLQGKAEDGTLLLDPSFLTINDSADGTGTLDGELTPDSDAELLSSVSDDGLNTNTISRGQLEAFGPDANIILETSGLLRVRDMAGNAINLQSTNGSLTIHAQSLTFNDVSDVIRTEGGKITVEALISQGKITGGGFDTTGLSGNKHGDISLSANTDISVSSIKTGGGKFTALADFDAAGQPGTFTINSGGQVSTAGGDALITGYDINLAGSLNAGAGSVSFLRSKAGISGSPATIGLGNAAGSFTLDGGEFSRITAAKVTIGNSTNDDMTVDGLTAAQTQNIGSLELDATRANRDVHFQNASSFNGLTVNSARDILMNAPVTANGAVNLTANNNIDLTQGNLTANGAAKIKADADGDGHGDLIMTTSNGIDSFINTNNHTMDITANDLERSFNAYFNSGSAAMSFASSDGAQIQVGDGTGPFTIRGDELRKITSGDLTLGDNDTGQIIFNGVQSVDLAGISGSITTHAGAVNFESNASHFANVLNLNASNGITLNRNFDNTKEININSDSDANGTGDFIMNTGLSLSSGSHTIGITANDFQLGSGSQISSGNAAMNITVSDGGTINLGSGAGDMTLSNSELQVLKAAGLTFGGTQTSINVDGVTDAGISNISGSLTLNAPVINFQNNNSSLRFLTANAVSGVNVNAAVDVTAGDLKINADSNTDGNGNLAVGAAGKLTTHTNHSMELKANDVQLDGALEIGQQGKVTFLPSVAGSDMGVNSSSKTFNLTTAELNRISVLNEGGTNLGKVVFGPDHNTGNILAAGDGLTQITSLYDMTLNFNNLSFGGRLSLSANNRTFTFNGGNIFSSGAREVNTNGGTGTLILNTTGDVDLIAFIDQLGPSTVGGHLNLTNEQTFKVTGDLNVGSSLKLSSNREIDLLSTITSHGLTTLFADNDRNGSGNIVGTNGKVFTNGGNLDVTAKDLQLDSASVFNAGAGDIFLHASNGGTISLGQGASSSFAVSHNELKQMTAANLTLGDSTNGNLTVTGVNELQTGNIANKITLNAANANSSVIFNTNSSAFLNSLEVNAGNGVNINKNLSTTNGTLTINADTDKNGTGNLTVADNTFVNSNNHSIDITANDLVFGATGQIDSFQAPMAIHVSDGGTIRLGNGAGDMTIDHAELAKLKAGDLTIGDASAKKIEADGVTLSDLANVSGNLTLKANDPAGQISFLNSGSTFKNLSAESGSLFSVAAAAPLTVTSGILSIKSADADLLGAVTNAAGEVRIENIGGGTIGLGATAGQMTLSGAEIQNITASLLHIVGQNTAAINGLTASNTANILSWNIETAGQIFSSTAASFFKNLSLSADSGIALNAPVTVGSGNFTGNADSNADGIGSFQTGPAGSLTVSSGQANITAADVNLQGAVQASSGTVTPSLSTASIGLNDAQGSFNLSAAELNFLNIPNLILGALNGTGAVTIGSLGAFVLNNFSSLTLRGGNVSFSNSMTLPNDASLIMQTGSMTGSGNQDIVIGGQGTLTVNASGPVSLGTSIAKLGASTVGGNFSLTNDKNLALTGKLSTKAANGNILVDAQTNTLTVQSGIESGNGNMTLRANDMELGAADSISGLGTISLEPGAAGTSIGIAGALGTVQLSVQDLAALHKNFQQINIGRADGAGKISIDEVSFRDPVVFLSPAAGGSILVDGAIHGLVNASIKFLGSGHTTTLNAGIDTNGRDVTIDDSVILGNDVTLTTGGGDVLITGNVNGAHNLTVNAADGNITFNGAVGNTAAVGSGNGYALDLSTSASDLTTFNSTVTANGAIHSTGSVLFKDDVNLGGAGTSVFLKDVTLDGLSFHGSGGMQFGDFDSDRVILSGGPVSVSTDNAALIFNARVYGNQDLTLNSGTAGTTFFADTGTENSIPQNQIGDGAGFALQILSAGTTSFQRLNLNSGIFAAGAVIFNKNVIISGGDTAAQFNGNVTLNGTAFNASNLGAVFGDSLADQLTLSGQQNVINSNNGNLVFNSKVDGAQNLALNTGTGTADFNAKVGSVTPVGSGSNLSVNSNSTGRITFHETLQTAGAIKTTGLAEFQKDVTLGQGNTQTLFNGDVNFGAIHFTAGHTVNFGNNAADSIHLTAGPVSLSTAGAASDMIFSGVLSGSQPLSVNAGGKILGGTSAVDLAAPLILLQSGSGIGADINPLIINAPLYSADGGTGSIFLINTFPGALLLSSGSNDPAAAAAAGGNPFFAASQTLASSLFLDGNKIQFADFESALETLTREYSIDLSSLDHMETFDWIFNLLPPAVVPIPEDAAPSLPKKPGL